MAASFHQNGGGNEAAALEELSSPQALSWKLGCPEQFWHPLNRSCSTSFKYAYKLGLAWNPISCVPSPSLYAYLTILTNDRCIDDLDIQHFKDQIVLREWQDPALAHSLPLCPCDT